MNSIIRKAGVLALASRLRILSDRLLADVDNIYKEQNLEFEPKWFLIFYQLSLKSPMAITEIAENIGKTHAAVNQLTTEMLTTGIIAESIDETDKRKRLISITEKGNDLLIQLKPVWNDIKLANKQLIDDYAANFLNRLDDIENSLDKKNMYQRIKDCYKQRVWKSLKFVDYQPEYKNDFKLLNEVWLKKYFTVEQSDYEMLENPEEKIIKNGGFIIFAKFEKEIIGCCAMILHGNKTFELAKMAVSEKYHGLKIAENMVVTVIEKAKTAGAESIFLITHEKLKPAINLYKKLGFKKAKKQGKIDYDRQGFKMNLTFKNL